MNAVDTNVLLYAVDRNEPIKQLKAQQLLQQLHSSADPVILLWQVLGDLVQQLRRWRGQGRLTPAEFSQHVRAFRLCSVLYSRRRMYSTRRSTCPSVSAYRTRTA